MYDEGERSKRETRLIKNRTVKKKPPVKTVGCNEDWRREILRRVRVLYICMVDPFGLKVSAITVSSNVKEIEPFRNKGVHNTEKSGRRHP